MSGDDEAAPVPGADPLASLSAPRQGWLARFEDATGGLVPVPRRVVVVVVVVGALVAVAWLVANRGAAVEPLPYTTPGVHGARVGTSVTSAPPGLVVPGPAPEGASIGTTTPALSTVWVSATGAVVRPGLYHLRAGARLSELLAVAGGLTADADPDRINLAAVVRDGERVYLPHRGEVSAPSVIAGGAQANGGGSGASTGSSGSGPDGQTGLSPPVNLNTATVEELDKLPGVGPSTATSIIDYRDRHGPFASVDDLRLVRGIGPAKLDALRGLVVV